MGISWGLIKCSISGISEMYPEKISFLHFFPTQTLMLLYYQKDGFCKNGWLCSYRDCIIAGETIYVQQPIHELLLLLLLHRMFPSYGVAAIVLDFSLPVCPVHCVLLFQPHTFHIPITRVFPLAFYRPFPGTGASGILLSTCLRPLKFFLCDLPAIDTNLLILSYVHFWYYISSRLPTSTSASPSHSPSISDANVEDKMDGIDFLTVPCDLLRSLFPTTSRRTVSAIISFGLHRCHVYSNPRKCLLDRDEGGQSVRSIARDEDFV